METPLDLQAAQAIENYQRLENIQKPTWQDIFIRSVWADEYARITGNSIENSANTKDVA